MKVYLSLFILSAAFLAGSYKAGIFDDVKRKVDLVYEYEAKNKNLIEENIYLKMRLNKLTASLSKLKRDRDFEVFSDEMPLKKRAIASIPKFDPNDLVQQDAYEWEPEKLKDTGAQALSRKDYERASQFYNAYLNYYPNHSGITPEVLFEAGISAYESKKHYDWAIKHFSHLISVPEGKHFRSGANLWLALSYYKSGDTEKFVSICKEYKDKYRNTPEWNIMKKYYEQILEKEVRNI